MKAMLYARRFEFLLLSYSMVLFGSLFFPAEIYHDIVGPLFLLLLAVAGINLYRGHRWRPALLGILLIPVVVLTVLDAGDMFPEYQLGVFAIYFVFFQMIAWELFRQIIIEKAVDMSLLLAAVCGLLALGILGAFGFMFLEIMEPQSFGGLTDVPDQREMFDEMLYYSFISVLTIGYGDMVPLTSAARKSSILLGVIGHAYTAIVLGVVIGKYFVQAPLEEKTGVGTE